MEGSNFENMKDSLMSLSNNLNKLDNIDNFNETKSNERMRITKRMKRQIAMLIFFLGAFTYFYPVLTKHNNPIGDTLLTFPMIGLVLIVGGFIYYIMNS